MWSVGTALKFWMCLSCHVEGVGGKLNHFNDSSIRTYSAELHAVLNKNVSKVVIDLVPVAVTFCDMLCAEQLICLRILIEYAGVRTKPSGTADILTTILVR